MLIFEGVNVLRIIFITARLQVHQDVVVAKLHRVGVGRFNASVEPPIVLLLSTMVDSHH